MCTTLIGWIVGFVFILFGKELFARDPVVVEFPAGKIWVTIEEGQLFVAREGGKPIRVAGEVSKITNFSVTKWMENEGLAFLIEAKEFGDDNRSYWWLTMNVHDMAGTQAHGQIVQNIDPLKILSFTNQNGDSIVALLHHEKAIPDTKRTLGLTYVNDCPRDSFVPGYIRISYLSESGVISARKESTHKSWKE